jgi:3-hydroxybutyryl-CoA dehydrogenase
MALGNFFTKIGVVGAGTMGSGIAHLFALHDYPVTLLDKNDDLLQKGRGKIEKYLKPDSHEKIFDLISFSTKMEDLHESDLVVEAVFEDEEVKKSILTSLNNNCGKETVFATNTSSISINSLAEAVENPSRFIGMHFMNPPVVMKLVEIVTGEKTAQETIDAAVNIAKKLDKVPAVVKDSPGFVSNRLLFAQIGEALRLLEKGIAQKEDIDAVMHYGMNHPMGPIALADFIGLDVCRDIMAYLFGKLGDDRYKPPPILENLIKRGRLGRKSGEGFYKYP